MAPLSPFLTQEQEEIIHSSLAASSLLSRNACLAADREIIAFSPLLRVAFKGAKASKLAAKERVFANKVQEGAKATVAALQAFTEDVLSKLKLREMAENCEEALMELKRILSPPRPHLEASPLASSNFAAILPGDGAIEVVAASSILNFLNIYNTLLICRLVLTWFPEAPQAIVNPLSTICDPYLNIFRGLIPPLGGGLDFSPILAFLVLNALTSTAEALPAELPEEYKKKNSSNTAGQQDPTFMNVGLSLALPAEAENKKN